MRLYAVRKGPYKAHFITQSGYGDDKPVEHDPPLLYHLASDPSEKYDLAKNRSRSNRGDPQGGRTTPQ